eukprot:scaffold551773_cov71-Attheya_sp.AAC.1
MPCNHKEDRATPCATKQAALSSTLVIRSLVACAMAMPLFANDANNDDDQQQQRSSHDTTKTTT